MRILLVEDEVKLAEAFKIGLEKSGYAVDLAHNGFTALETIEINHEDLDLIVLDVMLPEKNGFEICKEVRLKKIATPILLLTAKDAVSDKVIGLDSGADDYVVKPVAFAELLARIRSLLRRPQTLNPTKMQVRDIVLDSSTRVVTKNNVVVRLTSKEFAILELLMRRPGNIVSRESILSHVWDQSFDSFSNVVDVHIANLKRKLDNSKRETYIESIRGSGYRLKV